MKAKLSRGNFPSQPVEISIGGSKSESNRLLILQALFPNISLVNLSDSDDTQVLQSGLKVSGGTVDVHHAGTAMRFLTAYLAAKEGAEITLTGSKRMRERPIGILVDALKSLGAKIQYLENDGFPPLKIIGRTLMKSEVVVPASVSSQFISALMLIAAGLPRGMTISLKGKPISKPYIEMTLSLLNQLGINAHFQKKSIKIPPVPKIANVEIVVESDWSSASYFYSLVALSKGLEIRLRNFSEKSLQGDSILPRIYGKLGVKTVFNASDKSIFLSKEIVELPRRLILDLADTPDLAQTLAVSCFGLGIGCTLSGLQTLKIKETDRLFAMKKELSKLGAKVDIGESSLTLEPSFPIRSNETIETYQDHRMAMAFAPLAVRVPINIQDAGVVSKSYPTFWVDLKRTGISCIYDNP